MRILALCHRLDRTGAPIALFRLLRALAPRHEVALLMPAESPAGTGSLAADYEAAGIALLRKVEPARYDVVLVNTLLGARVVAWAAGRVPTVWWIHEPASGLNLVRDRTALARCFAEATRVVFPTRWQGEGVYGGLLAGRSFSVVPMGVPPAVEPGPSPFAREPGEWHLLQLGMVSLRKGADVALVALERLADPRLHLHFVGSLGIDRGIAGQFLDYAAARPRLRDRVHFHDAQPEPEVAAFTWHADLMLFPARDDLVTLAMLEGMAAGRCVVASDLPPLAETLVDGESALLFPTGDPDALASRIRQAVDDPALAVRVGEAGRRAHAARHGFAAHVAAMEAELLAAVSAAT